MKKSALLISALTLALLQGCGGDGGDDNAATPPSSGGDGGSTVTPPSSGGNGGGTVTPPPSTGDTGGVTARFVVTDLSRRIVFSSTGFNNGVLTNVTQAESGAMTQLDQASSSGSSGTKDIAGDASYALGRWVQGSDANSTHYAAYNILASLPTAGNYACALQSSTTPTSGSSASTGSVSGAIGLNFDTAGAHLSGNMTVAVGGQTVTASVPSSITNPSSLTGTGQFFAQGTGTMVQVADAGNGGYALMVAYAAKFPSGALYNGIARMSCTAN